jgi:predicted nucleic acid-binding protein
LIISDCVVTEFAAALSVKTRTAAIGEPARATIAEQFETLRQQALRTVPVSSSHFHLAARFAGRAPLGLRAGDALHVAIAAETGAANCTTDRRLATAAADVGVATELV